MRLERKPPFDGTAVIFFLSFLGVARAEKEENEWRIQQEDDLLTARKPATE